jgi:molecular chaperone IbpA
MRTNFDFTPFRRSTVGFDRLFDMLENGLNPQATETYPPFDLVQEDDDRYRIDIAVAGFHPGEIEVTSHQHMLTVSGRKSGNEDRRYIHRGIAARSFERRFALADYVHVDKAELNDGLLSIELVREIPEEMKPRRIEISSSSSTRGIEQSRQQETKAEAKQLEAA